MQNTAIKLVESAWFERVIIVAIVLNAITLGLETAPELVGEWMSTLLTIDFLFLLLFTCELFLKGYAYRLSFFKNGWNNFDFVIVLISWLPFIEGLSVLRSLRVLRVLRLISVVPQFRKVIQAFVHSLSGLAAIGTLLLILFYVGAVMTTKLFGQEFPEWFGNIGRSLYSLFQIMTLESWSMGIVRPVMEVYPYAWIFFVSFILLATFAVLNLLIGVIVDSMQTLHEITEDEMNRQFSKQDKNTKEVKEKIAVLEKTLRELKEKL